MKVSVLAQVCAVVFGLTSMAKAAVVEFVHVGHPVSEGGALDQVADPLSQGALPGMSGSLIFDTDLYGDGLTAGTELIVGASFGEGGFGAEVYSYSITRGTDEISSETGLSDLSDIEFLLSVTGEIERFFAPGSVGPNSARLRFDENGDIVDWFGVDFDGGPTDFLWNVNGASFGGEDGFCGDDSTDLCTNVAGTWETVVVSGVYPAPIPLPLPAALLFSGLVFLGGMRRLSPATSHC
ncbi:MAG: hypothetical protein AAGF78_06175 [Pseudomonadota bacterium]